MNDFIKASIRLGKAVKTERDHFKMMGECPEDDIDKALKDWLEAYQELTRLVNTGKE
jgi:hypothetical protein